MERVFENILRWLDLDIEDYKVLGNNIVEKRVPKQLFPILCERVTMNVTLNACRESMTQTSLSLVKREYVDDFWGKCRLTIELTEEDVVITYKFLGYEAIVNGQVVLVDSIKTMMELGD